MVIKNCVITGKDSEMLKPFIDDYDSYEYKQYGEYHTGVDLSCDGIVQSISFGTVAYIGFVDDTYNVIIIDEDGYGYNYSGFKEEPFVEQGDPIRAADSIGMITGHIHFEFLQKVTTRFPIRIGDTTLYKYNPQTLITDNRLLESREFLPDIRFASPDQYDDLMAEYEDEMYERYEDDEDFPYEGTYVEEDDGAYDEDDEPDNYGSEDTGYPENYEMSLDDLDEELNP